MQGGFVKIKKSKKDKRKKTKAQKVIEDEQVQDHSAEETQSDSGAHDFEEQPRNEESRKREHLEVEDDSDAEDKPKKKKKKKKLATQQTEGENKKNKKSIRQMKREKHALRLAELQAVSKDQLKSQCLNYLSQWKHDKQNWKFTKSKQIWLFKNMFSSHLVPDSSWPLLLEYFESAKGNIRNLLLEDANKMIKLMDEWTETQNGKETKDDDEDENEESEGPKKPSGSSYKRARDLIQCLQE